MGEDLVHRRAAAEDRPQHLVGLLPLLARQREVVDRVRPLVGDERFLLVEVLDAQAGKLAITRRIAGDIKDIWALQPRFDKRTGKTPYRVIEQPRYRAGWDFLRLRAQAGEIPMEIP